MRGTYKGISGTYRGGHTRAAKITPEDKNVKLEEVKEDFPRQGDDGRQAHGRICGRAVRKGRPDRPVFRFLRAALIRTTYRKMTRKLAIRWPPMEPR